jgi:thermostable 8-oxoguanine DNA glycosylase
VEKIGETGVFDLSISDHSLVYTVRQTRVARKLPRTITFRNYNKFDETKFF